ncbi:MAG: hypothetical protein ACRDUV_13455 [Pseudonocardiaceae bacterium]
MTVMELIERERKRQRLSVREAARRAGISDGWWRQSVRGGYTRGDVWVPAAPSNEVMMQMAAAVGVQREVAELLGVEVDDFILSDQSVEEHIMNIPGLSPELKRGLVAYYRASREVSGNPSSSALAAR